MCTRHVATALYRLLCCQCLCTAVNASWLQQTTNSTSTTRLLPQIILPSTDITNPNLFEAHCSKADTQKRYHSVSNTESKGHVSEPIAQRTQNTGTWPSNAAQAHSGRPLRGHGESMGFDCNSKRRSLLGQVQAAQHHVHVLHPVPVAVHQVAEVHVLHPRDGDATQAGGRPEGALPGAEAARIATVSVSMFS